MTGSQWRKYVNVPNVAVHLILYIPASIKLIF